MPRDAAATRQQILEQSYELFYAKGYYRVSVDDIAAAARLTKRTVYNHFESKDVLLAAVLEWQSELALARIRKLAGKPYIEPDDLVDDLFGALAVWAKRPRWGGAGFTRIAIELADMPGHPARITSRRHKRMLEAWFAEQLRKLNIPSAEERGRDIMLLIEGAMVLMLIHGDASYASAGGGAAKRLLGRPHP